MNTIEQQRFMSIVEEEVKRTYQHSGEVKIAEIGLEMPEGNTFYAEFNNGESDDFCYAFVQKNGECRLFDDGETLVRFFQGLLDKKRSILQRFSEFNFNDFIGAFIAFAVIGSFTILIMHASWNGNLGDQTISKEYLAIVSIVLGFYFGRSPKTQF